MASLRAGAALRRRSDEKVALATILVTALGIGLLLASVGSSSTTLLQIVGVTLVGAGSGLFGAVNSSMLIRLAPADKVGRTNAVRTLGTNGSYAVGLAVGLSVVTFGLQAPAAQAFFSGSTARLSPADISSLLTGYRLFWSAVLVLLLAVAAATWTTISARAEARNGSLAPGDVAL